jgi:transketolase
MRHRRSCFRSRKQNCDRTSQPGWKAVDVDGHDWQALIDTFDVIERKVEQQPTVIIAHTIKGKGVDFMEGAGAKYHGASFTKEQYEAAMASLGGDEE